MRTSRKPLLAVMLIAATALATQLKALAAVTVSETDIVIPTYLAGDPEPNPMFYFGRGSQGAQGQVYPYPLYDTLTNVKSNKTYRIVYLENEYVRIGILPEVGGRLFEAVDKSNGYNFIYRQHVIKPALIGLIGAWISGGIEWNIPHHHRASTFLPVQHHVEELADGSKTVWVGELEVRQRMRWAVGYTLSPGKSYLTAKLRILNRTPFVQTMLCFANVAVHVNDHYQVIFPPRTQYVTYHSKHDFTTWPIAKGRYSGTDFGNGTDVSWYSNHIAATSMFAWNYEDDFFAGYDHGQEAGIMSVADHHIVPGKKMWTWGNGPRGHMWDKILTDNDGPYVELMVGAYSDNQPDYSWLQPYETKSFEMHWYPFRAIGGVKQANLDAAVNLEFTTNGTAQVGFCTTAPYESAKVSVKAIEKTLLEETIAINPAKPYVKQITIPAGLDSHELRASLTAEGKELVAYSPVRLTPAPRPTPVKDPPAPKEIKTVEELYLAGQRTEQFHNPTLSPEPYWEEALQRDPGDARVNTALGIRQLKQARFTDAEQHFRAAIARLSANYTSPKDGEPYYYLGITLKGQGKREDAFDAFFKATWSEAWRGPAYFSLAEIATRNGDSVAALDYLDRSLAANALNIRALTLKAALLRHKGQEQEALAVLDVAARLTDPLDVRLMTERWLAGDQEVLPELAATLRDHPATGLETATEYGNAGLWQDGTAILSKMIEATPDKTRVSPLAYYYLGQFAERLGQAANAAEYRQLATKMVPDYCFPFEREAIHVLRRAMELNGRDARAPYYLGNLLFDWQPAEAVKLWERSAALDPSFPITHRNLAVAYSHQKPTNDLEQALIQLEQAVAAPQKYAAHFTELDELYASAGTPPEKRLALLEENHRIVLKRDDSLSREIGLKVLVGKYDEAIELMTGRKFSVWESGNLEVAEHWVNAHLLRAQRKIAERQFTAALADLQAAKTIPDNLPSDQGGGRGPEAELSYLTGLAYEGLGDADKAKQSWESAAAESGGMGGRRRGGSGPGGRMGFDRSETRYYQALAQQKLGQDERAKAVFREMANAEIETPQNPSPATSSFGGRQNPQDRLAAAHYGAGLGYLGLGESEKAKKELKLALEARPDHLGAKTALAQMR